MRIHRSAAFAVALAVSLQARVSVAASDACAPNPLSVERLIACALAHNEALKRVESDLGRAEGRRARAGYFLPSNPELELSAARRKSIETYATDIDRAAELSQTIEIAGQRSARVEAAEIERSVSERLVEVARHEVRLEVLESVVSLIKARVRAQFALEERERAVWKRQEGATKTDDPRRMPIHSELKAVLDEKRDWLARTKHEGRETRRFASPIGVPRVRLYCDWFKAENLLHGRWQEWNQTPP